MLGAGVEEPLPHRILPEDPNEVAVRQARVDARPRLAVIGRLPGVGRPVVELVAKAGHVGGTRRMRRRMDVAHGRVFFEVRRRHLCPRLPVVADEMDAAVVRAGPDRSCLVRRGRNGEKRRVDLRAVLVLDERPAGGPERLGIGVGQIRADFGPVASRVGGCPEVLGAGVNGAVVVRRGSKRGDPAPALGHRLGGLAHADVDHTRIGRSDLYRSNR